MNRNLNKKNLNTKLILIPSILIILLTIFYFIFINIYNSVFLKKKFVNFVESFSLNNHYLLLNLEVNKLDNIDSKEIEDIFNEYLNKSIFLVPINKISKEMLENKWIENISIKSDYKNTIKIMITESIPIGIHLDGKKFFLFDKNGKLIENINKNNKFYKKLIKFSNIDSFENAKLFIDSIPHELFKDIDKANLVNNRRWDIILKNGIKIKLSENNFSESFKNYDKIYKKISKSELDNIEMLDLRIEKKAIIKFKDLKND